MTARRANQRLDREFHVPLSARVAGLVVIAGYVMYLIVVGC